MSHSCHSDKQTGVPSSSSLDPFETSGRRSPPTADVHSLRIWCEAELGGLHPLRGASTEQRRIFGRDWDQMLRVAAAFTLHPPTDDVVHEGVHPKWCKRLKRVCECCRLQRLVVREGGGAALRATPCRDRCCPRCASARAKRVADRIAQLVKRMNAPRFITLTIETDGLGLSEAMAKLTESWRRLRRQPEWKERVKGGVYTVEVTRGKDGDRWHPHLHAIVDGDFFLQRMLSDCWLRVTGDSPIVDIRAVIDRRNVAEYIGRYVGKPIGWASWKLEELSEFARAMQGKRLVHTFGNLHNVKCDPPDELLDVKGDRKLCRVRELYEMVERGIPDALNAWEIMQQLRGPMGAITRRARHSGECPICRDATEEDLRSIADHLRNAIAERRRREMPTVRPPSPPHPTLTYPSDGAPSPRPSPSRSART